MNAVVGPRTLYPSFAVLGLFLALSGVAIAAGGWLTSLGVGEWYQRLHKPWFTPPNAVFGPVWTVLYVSMALAAWLVWQIAGWTRAHAWYFAQLAVNIAWSGFFFALQRPDWALVCITVLWLLLAVTLVTFWRRSWLAGCLLVPYLLWVSLAVTLNFAIWRLN